jgi:hypothetical protein
VRAHVLIFTLLAFAHLALSQPKVTTGADHTARIGQIIDDNVKPLPASVKGMIVAYLDGFGPPVYKTYGIATADGTVALNEKTVFGVGSREPSPRSRTCRGFL